MAVTLVQKGVPTVPGATVQSVFTVTPDTSYPNPAGYVFTPASFGFNILRKIKNVEPTSLPAVGTWNYWVVPTYNANDGSITSFALHLAVVATGVEVANAVNVSTATYVIEVEGN
jgi:hypothetical protein